MAITEKMPHIIAGACLKHVAIGLLAHVHNHADGQGIKEPVLLVTLRHHKLILLQRLEVCPSIYFEARSNGLPCACTQGNALSACVPLQATSLHMHAHGPAAAYTAHPLHKLALIRTNPSVHG